MLTQNNLLILMRQWLVMCVIIKCGSQLGTVRRLWECLADSSLSFRSGGDEIHLFLPNRGMVLF